MDDSLHLQSLYTISITLRLMVILVIALGLLGHCYYQIYDYYY
jgi:hypothetical protein